MKDFIKSSPLPLKLDDKAGNSIQWAFLAPMLLAGNCVLVQVCLQYLSRQQQCRNKGGFSFDVYSSFVSLTNLPFLGDIGCGDDYNQLFHTLFGVLIYIFIGLSIILPGILYLRRRPVLETKLFG